jgi:hypothetical protein
MIPDLTLLANFRRASADTISHPRTAAVLTYLSHFFSGEVDPFWPHVVLLSMSVLASFAVGAGIIFESPKYSTSVHRVATQLVIAGVIVEAACTIFLFVFDEGISNAQQDKIIALEKRLAARSLSDEQAAAFSEKLKQFSGQEFLVLPYWKNPESFALANRIADVLINSAGWKIDQPKAFTMIAGVLTGIDVEIDEGASEQTEKAALELINALNAQDLVATAGDKNKIPNPTNKISLLVGIKP